MAITKTIIEVLIGVTIFFGGYGAGNDKGYKDGYKQGWTEGRKNFVEAVLNSFKKKYEENENG